MRLKYVSLSSYVWSKITIRSPLDPHCISRVVGFISMAILLYLYCEKRAIVGLQPATRSRTFQQNLRPPASGVSAPNESLERMHSRHSY